MNAPVITATRPLSLAPAATSSTAAAPHGLVDAVVGRLIELVVQSVEGARDRVRGRALH